jgi:hypothetical protein
MTQLNSGHPENKSSTVSLLDALYAEEFDCTLCRNLLAQTEKQLELIPSFSQVSNLIRKSHMQHVEDKHKRKQTCISIISTTRRDQTRPWNCIKVFPINSMSIHGGSLQALCSALSLSILMLHNLNALMIQSSKGGCLYSVFPL